MSPRDGPPPEPPFEQNKALLVRARVQMEQARQHHQRELVRQRRGVGHADGLKKHHSLPQRARGAQEVLLGSLQILAPRVELPDFLTSDRFKRFQNRQAIDRPEAQVAELIVDDPEPSLSRCADLRPHERVEHLITFQGFARRARAIEDVAENLDVIALDDVGRDEVFAEPLADLVVPELDLARQRGGDPFRERDRIERNVHGQRRGGLGLANGTHIPTFGLLQRAHHELLVRHVINDRWLRRLRREPERPPERGGALLPVDDQVHIPLGRQNRTARKRRADVVGGGWPLPQQERAYRVAALHAVEQLPLVVCAPVEGTLKARQP